MKYVGVADDIIFAKTGERVDAEHVNVPLTFGDLGSIEIDLASDTYRQIREMLRPIFAAVTKASADPEIEAPKGVAVEMSGKIIYVTRETRHANGAAYKAALRAWAAKNGRLDEIKKYYYPVDLCDDFDAHLARNGG